MPLFDSIKPTSNLPRPNPDTFFKYFHAGQYWSFLGSTTSELEKRLQEVHDTQFCIAFPSGFISIVSCLAILNLPKHSEVITPSFSYRRFGDIVSWSGLVPRFCDTNPDRLAPTVDDVEKCISPNTSAILMVHPMVNVIDFSDIEDLAKSHSLPLIVDSVEAPYSSIGGRKMGSFGDAECFSMHASKFINGFEGGYVTTNREDLAHQLTQFRNSLKLYLPEQHAAMALSIMDEVPEQIQINKQRHDLYVSLLKEMPGITLIQYDQHEPRTYKNTLVRLEENWPFTREQTLRMLHSQNIMARPFWPALHQQQTMYSTLYSDLPVTNQIHKQYVLLPCGSLVSLKDIETICALLHRIATEDRETIWNELKWLPNNSPRKRTYTTTTNQDEIFQGILDREWYTGHGPLVEELEARLEKHLAIRNVIAISHFSLAFMIAVKAITPDTIRTIGSFPANLKKAAELINFTPSLSGYYRLFISQNCIKPKWPSDLLLLGDIKNNLSGYLCTDNDELADKIRTANSSSGIRQKKQVYSTGNGRMSEAQAAIELIGLNELEQAEPCV